MGRANLRRIGIQDSRIDTMTNRQAITAVLVHEAVKELDAERTREQEWLNRAATQVQDIPIQRSKETTRHA